MTQKNKGVFETRMQTKGFLREYYKTDFIESFLDNMDLWRRDCGMSKKKLAKKCKMTEAHFVNICNRYSVLSAEDMSDIAFALGYRLNAVWSKDTGTL